MTSASGAAMPRNAATGQHDRQYRQRQRQAAAAQPNQCGRLLVAAEPAIEQPGQQRHPADNQQYDDAKNPHKARKQRIGGDDAGRASRAAANRRAPSSGRYGPRGGEPSGAIQGRCGPRGGGNGRWGGRSVTAMPRHRTCIPRRRRSGYTGVRRGWVQVCGAGCGRARQCCGRSRRKRHRRGFGPAVARG